MTAPAPPPSLRETARRLRAREVSSLALTRQALERIDALDGALHAFLRVTPELALARAQAADQAFADGRDLGPMHGLPYALKDMIDVAGLPTTCQSMVKADTPAVRDATVERRLRAGGAVLLGKLSLHEFATSWPDPDAAYFPARNPWALDRIPGGSSSGAGTALAARLVGAAVGTDTGGSVRWPASACGVVGLKPTRGLVPTAGVFPLAPSLDHVGLMARSTSDIALILDVLADRRRGGAEYGRAIGRDIRGMKLGLARSWYSDAGEGGAEICSSVDGAAEILARLGATIAEEDIGDAQEIDAQGRRILFAESFALHRDALRERPEAFGLNTRRRLLPGASVSAADYISALGYARNLRDALDGGPLARYDAILAPSVLAFPPPLDAYRQEDGPVMPIRTLVANLTGHPALAFPTGVSRSGLPMGAQLIGRRFDEARLFALASAIERVLPVPCAPEADTKRKWN